MSHSTIAVLSKMGKIISENVYRFDKANPPIATAKPGETLIFRSLDCFSNKLTSEAVLPSQVSYGYNVCNPAAGPVYIEGAMPGDVLVVEILDIRVAEEGTITTDTVCGPLHEGMVERTKKIAIRDGKAIFNGIQFPIDPMIGVIGVAPAGESIIDGYPGPHGGNMDSRMHRVGSRIYFPVQVEGAMLQMGDVHAAMGDGELCGTGIEIPAEITVKTELIPATELHWPVTETPDCWYVNACDAEFPEALKKASLELQRLLMKATGWDAVDTYMYMSVQCNIEVDQACVPCEVPMILRLGAPKNEGIPPLIRR